MKTKLTKVLTVVLAVAIFATVAPMTAFAATVPELLPDSGELPPVEGAVWNDSPTMRGEAVMIIYHTLAYRGEVVPAEAFWHDGALDLAISEGWVTEPEDGEYRWNESITCAEMYQMIYNVSLQHNLPYVQSDWGQNTFPSYEDGILSGTPDWAVQAVNSLYFYSVFRAHLSQLGQDDPAWVVVSKNYDLSADVTHGRFEEFAFGLLREDSLTALAR